MAWRDEHPDRYGPIKDGDYVPFDVGERKHFVQAFGLVDRLAEVTACDLSVPDDWKRNPMRHPICGVVDCLQCLAVMDADADLASCQAELERLREAARAVLDAQICPLTAEAAAAARVLRDILNEQEP